MSGNNHVSRYFPEYMDLVTLLLKLLRQVLSLLVKNKNKCNQNITTNFKQTFFKFRKIKIYYNYKALGIQDIFYRFTYFK